MIDSNKDILNSKNFGKGILLEACLRSIRSFGIKNFLKKFYLTYKI